MEIPNRMSIIPISQYRHIPPRNFISMAFVQLLSFPSTSHFSTQLLIQVNQTTTLSSPLPKPLQFTRALSPHLSAVSPTSHTLSIKTQKSNSFLFSIQAQATVETPEIDSDSTEGDEIEEEDEASRTRVLAQNVPWTSTADDIRPLFEKYGTVVDIELSMYNKTRNRGLAFVTMDSHEEASAALNNLESSEFEGRTLKLTWAKPKKKKTPPVVETKPAPVHNLFVANLPFQARAKDLKEFFSSENGNAVSAEVIFHENPRRSAGYGFVSFYTKEEAEAALSAFQGKVFMGRPIRVAQSKRFLRQGTKASLLSENATTKLRPNTEQLEEAHLA